MSLLGKTYYKGNSSVCHGSRDKLEEHSGLGCGEIDKGLSTKMASSTQSWSLGDVLSALGIFSRVGVCKSGGPENPKKVKNANMTGTRRDVITQLRGKQGCELRV